MNRLDGIAPLLFVGIWATGFVLARFVGPYAEPLAFPTLRFALSAFVFALLALAAGTPWPRSARAWGAALLCGVLMQGAYLFGVFWSVRHGLPAGIAALVGGLQPLLTAALAISLLGEAVGPRRAAGSASVSASQGRRSSSRRAWPCRVMVVPAGCRCCRWRSAWAAPWP